MKLALCFSGQPRFVNECSDLILSNVIQDYNVDVFAHLWFDDALQSQPYKHGGDGKWKDQRIPRTAIDDFINNPFIFYLKLHGHVHVESLTNSFCCC